jgi:plasmid stabilization system protein ParE
MSEIIWLPEAIEDLERHFNALKTKDLESASHAADTIRQAADNLSTFPERYPRVKSNSPIREMYIPFGKYGYVLQYFAIDGIVYVLQVYHGREKRLS